MIEMTRNNALAFIMVILSIIPGSLLPVGYRFRPWLSPTSLPGVPVFPQREGL
jgi:hypothetical protein